MSDQLEITRTQKLPFKFTGNGFEYFRIWIVNVLFTIITFGIYSAWAKVRTKSYFYRNTKVAGSGFEYHASPTQILKGRLLSFVVYVVFIVATESQLVIASIIAIITVLAMPWLIVRAHVFNARNSSWRNIRFDFNEHSQSDAWMVFLVYPALIPFTLGMIIPYISYRGWRFSVTNSRIGRQPFSFHSVRVGAYYRVFFAMMLPFVMIALLWFVASGGSSLFNLGLAYGNAGQYEEAIASYKEAIRIKPDDADAHYNLGVTYGESGQYEEAIASYKEALRIKPDDADAHYNLGYVYRELGQYEEAIASFKKSIHIKPDDADAHYNLGYAYRKLGQYEEAIASFKKSIRIKPDDANAHFNLGLAYDESGQYEEAIASYKEVLRIKQDDADAHYNLGYVYRELGQYEEAIASFKKSIRIKPDDANAHYSLGLAYDESGQYEEAIASYKEVLRIKPDDADAHFFLVLAYVNAGQYEEAIASYSGIGFSALMITMIILLALIAVPAYRVMTRNVSLNGVTLGDHTLESTLKVWPVIWIYISNAVAIVFSVGLLIPWARVRVTRYLANHLVLNAADDLESFVRTEAKKAGALGEEAADFMDIDIGGI